jgi:probable addiction module antidote protein
MIKVIKHDDWLHQQLADAEFAAEYLNAASEDEDPASYLTALRMVVEARGGVASVAEKTHLSRETLYRTLSARGNPTIKTLTAVLKATGLKIQCHPAKAATQSPAQSTSL